MVDKEKKEALAKAFGVQKLDGVVSVPTNVPNLLNKINCTKCTLKTVAGLPVEFVQYMSDEQKATYKEATGYTGKKVKSEDNRVHGVPENTVEG